MSWRISIMHRSIYRYAEPVIASYNEVRLVPQSVGGQTVLSATVSVMPATSVYRYEDYFKTAVISFDIPEPHRELVVVGKSVVDTANVRPRPTGLTWGELDDPAIRERFAEYLETTTYATGDQELLDLSSQFRTARSPFAAVESVGEWIRESMTYEIGATGVSTSAVEAWRAKRGVCQDFAHLGLVLLRAIGVPTRYVSGYLHPHADADIGVAHSVAGHAWMECWVGAWYPIDPTHGARVGDRYVIVARGRDYADVAPFRGIYQGGALAELDVAVDLKRLA